MAEREEIEQRFRANLERVRGLVSFYEAQAPIGQGRRPVPLADLLRAAVVFLHASLEDLLRSMLEWKLPSAPGDLLKEIPLAGMDQARFTLSDLSNFRGEMVDSVIERSVRKSLSRASYSNVNDIVRAVKQADIGLILATDLKDELTGLMNRRHLIAHRADRNPDRGAGHQSALSISVSSVNRWIGIVEQLGNSILSRL